MVVSCPDELTRLGIGRGDADQLAHEDVLGGPEAASFLERAPGGRDGIRQRERGDDPILSAASLDVVKHRLDESQLGPELVVDRGARDVGPPRDLLDRRAVEAVLGEHRARGRDDARARLGHAGRTLSDPIWARAQLDLSEKFRQTA